MTQPDLLAAAKALLAAIEAEQHPAVAVDDSAVAVGIDSLRAAVAREEELRKTNGSRADIRISDDPMLAIAQHIASGDWAFLMRSDMIAFAKEFLRLREIIQSHELNDWHAIADQRSAALIAAENEIAKAREAVKTLVRELSCHTRTSLGDRDLVVEDAVAEGRAFLGPAAPQQGGQT